MRETGELDPQEVKDLEKADTPEIVEAAPTTVGETLDFGVSDEPTLVGQVLSSRYRITGQVGSGAMGTVYRAEHVLMEGQVHAIKVLHKHLTSDAHSLQRFQVEAKRRSALRHDRLLTVTDFGLTETNQPYIVMDYIAGESLADVLKRQRTLSIQEFVEVFTQVCEGPRPRSRKKCGAPRLEAQQHHSHHQRRRKHQRPHCRLRYRQNSAQSRRRRSTFDPDGRDLRQPPIYEPRTVSRWQNRLPLRHLFTGLCDV